MRDRLVLPASVGEAEVRAYALASERVQRFTANGVANVVYVPRRLLNIVTRRGGPSAD